MARKWLNHNNSVSTGSVVAYSGPTKWGDKDEEIITFLEIADCYKKVRLHKTYTDSVTSFVKKLRLLARVITDFADYLERQETK